MYCLQRTHVMVLSGRAAESLLSSRPLPVSGFAVKYNKKEAKAVYMGHKCNDCTEGQTQGQGPGQGGACLQCQIQFCSLFFSFIYGTAILWRNVSHFYPFVLFLHLFRNWRERPENLNTSPGSKVTLSQSSTVYSWLFLTLSCSSLFWIYQGRLIC